MIQVENQKNWTLRRNIWGRRISKDDIVSDLFRYANWNFSVLYSCSRFSFIHQGRKRKPMISRWRVLWNLSILSFAIDSWWSEMRKSLQLMFLRNWRLHFIFQAFNRKQLSFGKLFERIFLDVLLCIGLKWSKTPESAIKIDSPLF